MYTVSSEKTRKLGQMIADASRISIVTHTRPDGDAIGSSTALKSYLTDCRGKEARILLPDSPSDALLFMLDETDSAGVLCYDAMPDAAGSWLRSSDLIIALDFNTFSRTDSLQELLRSSGAVKALIDHHLDPDTDAFELCISESGISSTCELLFWVLMSMTDVNGDTGSLPAPALRALMAGMTTDTNNFANSVFPSTLEMASLLLDAGVDRDWILDKLYNSFRENRLRLTGHLLSDVMRISTLGVAYTILSKEEQERYGLREGELEGYVNMPLSIGAVRMSIFLKEDDGYFRVSIRSKRGTSANLCAKTYFNGGGHEQASGGRLYFPGDIEHRSQAAAYIEKVTEEFFSNR